MFIITLAVFGLLSPFLLGLTCTDDQEVLMYDDDVDQFEDSLSLTQYVLYNANYIAYIGIIIIAGFDL